MANLFLLFRMHKEYLLILSCSYLVWQYPNSIFMQKLPVGKWIGAMIFLWGLSLAASAGSKNFASFATSRFFLGAFEAANNPAFTLLVGQYFTRREQALRASIWWAGGPIGAFVGDGLSFSVGHWHGSLARWQVSWIENLLSDYHAK